MEKLWGGTTPHLTKWFKNGKMRNAEISALIGRERNHQRGVEVLHFLPPFFLDGSERREVPRGEI